MKKIAIVASGWHFPISFFEQISEQKIPTGWERELFLVAHRDPFHALTEKQDILKKIGFSRRELYDRIMYRKVATVDDIEALGWKYTLESNTIGDWGNSNQWLEKNDYKKYDKFLFTHDDNFILTDEMLCDILPQNNWLILTNSRGNTQRRLRRLMGLPKPLNIRGSFEFFTREMLDILGGKFDLSNIQLDRSDKTKSGLNYSELSDWNNMITPLQDILKKKKLDKKVAYLSKYYRVSRYCIEGERGFISMSDPLNNKEEEQGLDNVEKLYSRKLK